MGNHVISLVHKLTKREKFYFSKLYSDSKTKNFVRIYTFINSHNPCTIADIKAHFKNSPIENNLPSELNLLYKRLLRALNIYNINLDRDEFNLHQSVQNIRILLSKEEQTQARKILAKAKKKAAENEEYSSLVKLISLQEEIEATTISNNIIKQFSKFEEERRTCFEKIGNFFKFQRLLHSFITIQYTNGIAINEPSKFPYLFENPLLENRSSALSKRSLEMYLSCKNFQHYLSGNYTSSLPYSKERISLVQQNPHIFKKNTVCLAINNHVMSLIGANLYDKAVEFIAMLDNFSDVEDPKKTIPYIKNYLTLIVLVDTNSNEKLTSFIRQSQAELQEHLNSISSTQRDQWYFNIFIGLFHLKQFNKALDLFTIWSQFTIQEHNFLVSKLVRCICFCELKQYQLLESESENLIKLNRREAHKRIFITSFYQFFQSYIKKKNLTIALAKLRSEITQLKSTNNQENQFMKRLDIYYWLDTAGDSLLM